MSRIYLLAGYFLIGVSGSGLLSLTASLFPKFGNYSIWLIVIAGVVMTILAICDDYFAELLNLTNQQYVGLLASVTVVLILGSLIQWVK